MAWKQVVAGCGAVLVLLVGPVFAEVTPAAMNRMPDLAGALMRADGSVDLVIGVDPGPEELVGLLDLLAVSSADQVRLSTLYDPETLRVTADQKAVLTVMQDYIAANGLDWHVCEGWWGTPGREHLSQRIAEDFGGSLLFIDNGLSSDVIDNPSADLMESLSNDPAFANVFVQPERLIDVESYWNAVEAFWSQVMLDNALDPARRGGWKDGC